MAEVKQLDERRRHSVSELIRELSQETSTLVRQEVELAKVELSEKAQAVGVGGGLLAAAALISFLALGAFTAAAIAALALVLATWLAALVVGGAYLLLAGILGAVGYGMVKRNASPTPEETVETVREDVQWIRQKSKSATK